MASNIALLPSFKTGIMLQPQDMPIALPVQLDFSATGRIEFDLQREQTNNIIDFVQTIYVNNVASAQPITFTFPGGQQLDVPAGAQGYYPVAAEFGKFTLIAESAGGLIIPIQLLNVPTPSQQWGPITVSVQNVTATFTPTAGTFSDMSGNTTAGASAALFAANANAIRRVVKNPTQNMESIFINFGGVAASALTWEIPPGGEFDTGTGPIDQTAWDIFAVNAIPFIAYEMV